MQAELKEIRKEQIIDFLNIETPFVISELADWQGLLNLILAYRSSERTKRAMKLASVKRLELFSDNENLNTPNRKL